MNLTKLLMATVCLAFLAGLVAAPTSLWENGIGGDDLAGPLARRPERRHIRVPLASNETRVFYRAFRKIDVRARNDNRGVASLDFRGQFPDTLAAASRGDCVVRYGEGTLVLWTCRGNTERYRPRILSCDVTISCFAISQDSRYVATGHRDGVVVLWDAGRGIQVHRLQAHAGAVSCVCFARNGLSLLSARRTVRIWDAATGNCRTAFAGHRRTVDLAEFSVDGRHVIWCDRSRTTLHCWDTVRNSEVWRTRAGRTMTAIAYSPDGRLVASGDERGQAAVWDATTGRRLCTVRGASMVSCVRFSTDGSHLHVNGGHQGLIPVDELVRSDVAANRESGADGNGLDVY